MLINDFINVYSVKYRARNRLEKFRSFREMWNHGALELLGGDKAQEKSAAYIIQETILEFWFG